jgi:hypothetical protein
MTRLLLLLIGAGLTVAATAWLPAPFVWVAALWCVVAGAAAALETTAWRRALWINVGAVIMALGGFELYLCQQELVRYEGSYTHGYSTEHDVLGYAPVPGRQSRAIKYHGKELIYDTVYTIDSRGLRVSPPTDQSSTYGSILFFGGSVTFGEGVDDARTMPYRVGVKTHGRYHVYNFGFHGYGPHQMLSALEHDVVAPMVMGSPVTLVIYQGMPAHVARAAGLSIWDQHGPKYVLSDQQGPAYLGHFDGHLSRPIRWLQNELEKSFVFRKFREGQRAITPDDIRLYVAIVTRARDVAAARFPEAQFHVLLWGWRGEETFDAIRDGLQKANITVHQINDILPRYTDNPASYELSPHDRHPTAQAHELIADYVATHIIGKATNAAR